MKAINRFAMSLWITGVIIVGFSVGVMCIRMPVEVGGFFIKTFFIGAVLIVLGALLLKKEK